MTTCAKCGGDTSVAYPLPPGRGSRAICTSCFGHGEHARKREYYWRRKHGMVAPRSDRGVIRKERPADWEEKERIRKREYYHRKKRGEVKPRRYWAR